MPHRRLTLAGLAIGLALVSSVVPSKPAAAGHDGPLSHSMASDALVDRTRLRILRADGRADGICQAREFLDARVMREPVVTASAFAERKWLERWTLNRCGTPVVYWIFFTDVGDGGTYLSFQRGAGQSD